MFRLKLFTNVIATAVVLIITLNSVNPALATFGDAPPNDNFANATIIPALSFIDSVDNTNATYEIGEPSSRCAPYGVGHTVWYTFTPTTNTYISVGATSSSFSPLVAVYSGNSLDNLTLYDCDFNNGVWLLELNANTTYYIQVSSAFDSFGITTTGLINFHMEVVLPQVEFSYSPTNPSVFDAIQFTDSSTDPAAEGIQSYWWDFGDGITSTEENPLHQYAKDGNYIVQHTVTTVDGRTATIFKGVLVETHDVAITKISVPNSANAGQTKPITVYIYDKRYPETIEVDLYKSNPNMSGGYEFVGTYIGQMPLRSGNRTLAVTFSYTFTTADASIGKVTFAANVSIINARDGFPADNTLISAATKVNK